MAECFASGSVQVKLRAWNVFSSVEVDVDVFASAAKTVKFFISH